MSKVLQTRIWETMSGELSFGVETSRPYLVQNGTHGGSISCEVFVMFDQELSGPNGLSLLLNPSPSTDFVS